MFGEEVLLVAHVLFFRKLWRMRSNSSFNGLRHDPAEQVAALPQIHLIDHRLRILRLLSERWDDEIKRVAPLLPDIDFDVGRHLHADARQRSAWIRSQELGKGWIRPGELDQTPFQRGIPRNVRLALHWVFLSVCPARLTVRAHDR